MVSITSLWLPILLSAVFVFLASFVMHMVLKYHHNDFRKVPGEDKVMEALRGFDLPPGDYMMPRPDSMEAMKKPEFIEKRAKGPVLVMTVMPKGEYNMGASLIQWFLHSLVIGTIAAYVTGRALGPGAPYLEVFRFAGTTAFVAYAIAMWQDSIWYHRAWGTTIKNTIDGLIYGCLTAGTFGWLWPK